MRERNAVCSLLAVTLLFAGCFDDQSAMMDAELPEDPTSEALDRAGAAPTMRDDARYELALAVIGKLLAEHPEAAGGRISVDGLFGTGYRGEPLVYQGQTFERVAGDAKVPAESHTITLRGLKMTATNEATLVAGMLYAEPDGYVEDHVYEVVVTRGSDGVWTADLIYMGHFDGVLETR